MARYLEPWCERCGERPQTDSLIVCAECARDTGGRATVLTWRADPGVCAVCGVAWSEHVTPGEYLPHLPAGVEFGNVAQAREFVVKVMGVGRGEMSEAKIELFMLELLTDVARRNYEREMEAVA